MSSQETLRELSRDHHPNASRSSTSTTGTRWLAAVTKIVESVGEKLRFAVRKYRAETSRCARGITMRIPARCIQCGGRALTYATIQGERYTIRYKRCDCCGVPSKSIQMKIGMSSNKSIDVALSAVTMIESPHSKE